MSITTGGTTDAQAETPRNRRLLCKQTSLRRQKGKVSRDRTQISCEAACEENCTGKQIPWRPRKGGRLGRAHLRRRRFALYPRALYGQDGTVLESQHWHRDR